MIEDMSAVDRCGGLRDQFCPSHCLPVPVGCAVKSDFHALGTACVGGVLVAWGKVDVFGDVSRAVLCQGLQVDFYVRERWTDDVVLIRSYLVAPRPIVEIGAGGEFIEAPIPKNSTSYCRA